MSERLQSKMQPLNVVSSQNLKLDILFTMLNNKWVALWMLLINYLFHQTLFALY